MSLWTSWSTSERCSPNLLWYLRSKIRRQLRGHRHRTVRNLSSIRCRYRSWRVTSTPTTTRRLIAILHKDQTLTDLFKTIWSNEGNRLRDQKAPNRSHSRCAKIRPAHKRQTWSKHNSHLHLIMRGRYRMMRTKTSWINSRLCNSQLRKSQPSYWYHRVSLLVFHCADLKQQELNLWPHIIHINLRLLLRL